MERYFPYAINIKKKYINPFRSDKKPGCNFKYDTAKRFLFVDWSYRKSYDCFEVCKLNCKLKSLYEVLRTIDKDFNLNIVPSSFKIKDNITNKDLIKSIYRNKTNKLSIKTEIFPHWTKKSLEYWEEYGITEEDLNFFNVMPCTKCWFNDEVLWLASPNNPIYRYKFKEGIQIYRPKSNKNKGRFSQNLPPNYLLGLEQLPEIGNVLIITSSYKDVIVLYKIGISAVCPIGESGIIDKNLLENLKKRFKKIVINFNPDDAGVLGTGRLATENNFSCFFTPYEKDPSDLVKLKNYEELKKIYGSYN